LKGKIEEIKIWKTKTVFPPFSQKHPYFRDKETVRQTDSSARVFSPARKIHLFLGSLSSLRNHALSPPDGFLTRLPDFQRNCHGNKDAYLFLCFFDMFFYLVVILTADC